MHAPSLLRENNDVMRCQMMKIHLPTKTVETLTLKDSKATYLPSAGMKLRYANHRIRIPSSWGENPILPTCLNQYIFNFIKQNCLKTGPVAVHSHTAMSVWTRLYSIVRQKSESGCRDET